MANSVLYPNDGLCPDIMLLSVFNKNSCFSSRNVVTLPGMRLFSKNVITIQFSVVDKLAIAAVLPRIPFFLPRLLSF